jgi:predicted nucleic acid-binding protein
MELADTSAWVVSRRNPAIRDEFDAQLVAGEIATCGQVTLELLYSTRDIGDFRRRREQLSALPQCVLSAQEWNRAIDVFEMLADRGPLHHRQVKPADLLIAAAAETAGIRLLHYDSDYEAIASVTGQDVRWVSPRGSI